MGLMRLVLALVVAGDHFFLDVLDRDGFGTRGIDQWIGMNGGFAVIAFYAISGFLISYVLSHKYAPGADGVLKFYRSRFARIFSLYWPMLLACALLFDNGPRGFLDRAVSLIIVGGDWVVAFRDYPAEHNPYFGPLGPVWSIAAELTFYAMAPWLLRSLPLSLACFAASLALRLWLQGIYGFHQAWTYHLFPTALCFFLAGHLARVAGDWCPRTLKLAGLPLLAGSAFAVWMTLETGSWLSPWFYVAVLSFALSLPWLFDSTKDNRALNLMGDLSYPLYLCHLSLIVLLFSPAGVLSRLIVGRALGDATVPIFLLLFLAAAATVSQCLHRLVEQPCRRLLAGRNSPSRA